MCIRDRHLLGGLSGQRTSPVFEHALEKREYPCDRFWKNKDVRATSLNAVDDLYFVIQKLNIAEQPLNIVDYVR